MENEKRLICPFLSMGRISYGYCVKQECMWWCDGEKGCSIKVTALQLIKLEEIGK